MTCRPGKKITSSVMYTINSIGGISKMLEAQISIAELL